MVAKAKAFESLSCSSACSSTCLPACLPSCLPAFMPACLHACLPACLHACLPSCLPACLPSCLPACLPSCLPACPSCRSDGCVQLLLLQPDGNNEQREKQLIIAGTNFSGVFPKFFRGFCTSPLFVYVYVHDLDEAMNCPSCSSSSRRRSVAMIGASTVGGVGGDD